jgi:hypothetical protein
MDNEEFLKWMELMEERLLLRIEKSDSKIDAVAERLLLRIEKIETALLNEFRKWAIPASGRMKTYEATLDEYRVRLGFIEDRLDALEHPPEAN